MVLVVGCSNDNNNNTENQTNSSTTNNNEATNNSENNDEEELLSLGDTGVHETTIGDYEVTPTAIEMVDSIDGEKPSRDDNDFIIIDVTIKNIGDTVLEGKEVAKVDMNDDLTTRNTKKDFDEINHLDGEIEPDEEVEGQLVFNTIPDS